MPTPLQTNAADPAQLKHGRRKERQRLMAEQNDLAAVMKTRAGRAFVWRLLGSIFNSTFSRDAITMAFAEGGRNVALELRAKLEGTDELRDLYLTMEREQRQLLAQAQRENEAVQQQPGGDHDGND